MNLLLLSVGIRNKIVQFFKENLLLDGKVICTDRSKYAPALYEADNFYVVPSINDDRYIDVILDICEKENINGILSFIDPELELLAENKKKFDDINVEIVLSPFDVIKTSFNKYEFHQTLTKKGFPTQKTYLHLDDVVTALEDETLRFPLFVKPNQGSASVDIQKVSNLKTLENLYENAQSELITQEYIDGKEYGIDVYIDLITKEVISIFIKEKWKMRAGETDKSISIKNEDMTQLIKRFIEEMGYLGPVDIDLFEKDGAYYISEVNPRFGGGCPHAYLSGCNFPKFIIENLKGNANLSVIGEYSAGTVMLKYSEIMLLEGEASFE